MDYRNILEGTRPFFQGLPFPSSNVQGGNSQGTSSPLSLPQNNHLPQLQSSSKESNSSSSIHPISRFKYEEGLGATLSQMYSARSPTLRTPLTQLSSSSPTILNGQNSLRSSPCPAPPTPHHLSLRGGSSSSLISAPIESNSSGPAPPLLPSVTPSSSTKGNSVNSTGGPQKMVVRRESPLDLSVKTVRQSADSSTNSNLPGERSVSSSGASTPNPEAMSSRQERSTNNVIAAVANSTTGRNPGKEAYIQSSTNSPMIQNHHPTPPVPPAPSTGIEGQRTQDPSPSPHAYAYSQNHHLFSPHYSAAVAAVIPSSKPPLPYSHYELSSTPRQSPAPASLSNSVSVPGSGSTITTSVASSSTPQHPSRPNSVIPPYNPPAPNFGVGLGVSMNPYGHQQPSAPPPPQQHPTQPSYHPQNPYPYHQAHHTPYSYSPYANHNGNPPGIPTSSANNQQQQLGNGNLSQYPPTSSYASNNNPQQQQQPEQSYGIPSHYPFQNYYLHPQQQQDQQQQHHRPQHPTAPSSYPISQYVNPPGGSYAGALPVQYQHTQNRMPHSYYPYHNQPANLPRRPPPTAAQQQPPPTSTYPPFPQSHNLAQRLPAPPPPPPLPPPQQVQQQQQKQPSPAVSSHHKEDKPPPKPRATSPNKQPKREKQSGGKRKDILNLLRNSVETRIHEKQEKEKTVVNHTSTNQNQAYWNFHGKKYPVPVPPPPASGSILTGMSHANASGGPNQVPANNPGLFGINQRSNFMESSQPSSTAASLTQALSPNNDSLSRIRTKAEKKQVFPNLLSQIEQENSMKQQLQMQHHQQFGGTTSTTSVFDFQDEEEDSKKTLNLNRTKSPIPGAGPPPLPLPSTVPNKPRKSGSKKFPNKNKENFSSIDSTIESCIAQAISESFEKPEKKEVPTPSSSSVINRLPPAVDDDNIDEFWATCDSFVNDLSANPTTIKSRRGGLWAKLKPTGSKVKNGKSVGDSSSTRGRNRIRRNSADVDQDFEIESSSDEDDEEAENSASESKSEDVTSIKSTEKTKANRRNSTDDQPPAKKRKRSRSESSEGSDKSGTSDDNDSEEVPLKGTKVGKRTLRKRRAGTSGSLIGKSVTRDSEESSSDDGDSSDSDSVATFSISSISGSEDSDDSNSSSNSSYSSDDDSNSSKSDRSSSGDENSDDSESKTKTKSNKKPSRSNSRKGERNRKSKKSTGKRGRSTRSGGKRKSMKDKRKGSKRRKSTRKDGKRKLRPKRTCAQAKLKDLSGASDEERGSSGEEWIMRGELGKKKRRIAYGDGSEFQQPGWEEELIDFKRKLRMPSKLIRVAKPASLCSSTKSKDLEESTPPPNSTTSSAAVTPIMKTPNKSIKENKTPATTTPVKTPEKKAKGRPPKSAKTDTNKKGTPVKNDVSDSTGKSPAKKGKGKDKPLEERREVITPVLLPTPGKPGAKFNKKMSIKSVFGTMEPEPKEPAPPATPQVVCVASPAPSTTTKKTLRRNKFKSGFDYIRKKKKATPNSSTADGSISTPSVPKRPKISQEKNMTEEDIQAEIRGWVLNKGLGETAIHRAARLGYPDVAAYCLEYDICSPNCKDNAGYSPLHETCIKGNLEVAKILLAYGANPSQAAPGGIRPLHEACENGQVELVRLLLAYGADPLLATYAGITPLELAEHHPKVKLLLEQHIKDVQGADEKPWEFRGTGPWAEANMDNGYDVTSSPPPPQSPDNSGDGFEFESSELPLPPIYMLHGSAPYIMMQDLVNYVGLPKDQILRNHSGAVLEELNSNDFLEDAHCRQLLGTKFRLNSSSDLLTLIKYDDTVKKMLNIESCTIK